MSTVIKSPSPKSRFQEQPKRIESHRDMVASAAFEIAADYAILNYAARLATSVNPATQGFNEYAVVGVKICAALEYLQEMRLLAETRTVTATPPQDNLSHNV